MMNLHIQFSIMGRQRQYKIYNMQLYKENCKIRCLCGICLIFVIYKIILHFNKYFLQCKAKNIKRGYIPNNRLNIYNFFGYKSHQFNQSYFSAFSFIHKIVFLKLIFIISAFPQHQSLGSVKDSTEDTTVNKWKRPVVITGSFLFLCVQSPR